MNNQDNLDSFLELKRTELITAVKTRAAAWDAVAIEHALRAVSRRKCDDAEDAMSTAAESLARSAACKMLRDEICTDIMCKWPTSDGISKAVEVKAEQNDKPAKGTT